MTAPCKDCFDRKLLCHSSCERYKAWRAELDRLSAERQREKAATPQLCWNVVKQIYREMRGRRR